MRKKPYLSPVAIVLATPKIVISTIIKSLNYAMVSCNIQTESGSY